VGRARHGWQAGRRAYDRLAAWHRGTSESGTSDAGENALDALTDIGALRRHLEQAELTAVRAARRQGKSWAEIATRLGITRQSAWERWRDLDEGPADGESSTADTREADAPKPLADPDLITEAASRALTRAAMSRRRGSTVVVPNVVGMSWDDARSVLRGARLVGVGPDPDGPPLSAEFGADSVVTDQSPESGARVAPGTSVTLWLERGGGSGVREPRRPAPSPRVGRAMIDEQTGEAVG
jgi:hypothetical protein